MNKAITDGLVLMPTPFAAGLDVWSSGDGTPGSDTYENASNAAFVPADQDFGGALELLKTQATQQLRYMGQTTLLPGCYLRVTARVKAVSGNLPSVRIAGYPAQSGGGKVGGVPEFGPATTLTSYGEVVEVSAIIGSGDRGGVDMVWGTRAAYGHFGLDLIGPTGGVVRIDDIEIEDVTSVFLRDMLAQVDVRDFGAVGNGVTDDTAAFEAAHVAADGRTACFHRTRHRGLFLSIALHQCGDDPDDRQQHDRKKQADAQNPAHDAFLAAAADVFFVDTNFAIAVISHLKLPFRPPKITNGSSAARFLDC